MEPITEDNAARVKSRDPQCEYAPLLFCVGYALAEAVTGRGNVEHVEQLCIGAVEEVASQISTKAQRGHWHSPDMTCTGRVVARA